MHIFDARNPGGTQAAEPAPTPTQESVQAQPYPQPHEQQAPAKPKQQASDDDVLSDSFLELDNWSEKNAERFSDGDRLELENQVSDADEQWAQKLLNELDDDAPSQSEAADNTDLDGSTPGRRANLSEATPETPEADEEAASAQTEDEQDDVFDFGKARDDLDDEIESFSALEQSDDVEDTGKRREKKSDPFDFEGFDDEPELGDELLDDDFSREQLITAIEPAPLEFHITDDRRKWLARGLWFVLLSSGLLALITQIAWFNFDQKARDPEYRGWYAAACSIVGCKLPVQQDLNAIKASNLVVRSHPKISGALVVDAILTNSASFTQTFPALELIFTNMSGKPVAARSFKPNEYLHGEMTGAKQLLSQRPVHISLEIIDPGKSAVNYSLQLHQI